MKMLLIALMVMMATVVQAWVSGVFFKDVDANSSDNSTTYNKVAKDRHNIDSEAIASHSVRMNGNPVGADGPSSTRTVNLGNTAGVCSLTLNRVDVSGCYSVSGVSKATVSVEVGWQNAPTSDYIVVTTAGQSRTIVPGITTVTYPQPSTIVIQGTQNIVTPQVVAFEITLTGAASSSTVTAKFVGSASCQDSQVFNLPAACPPTSCSGLGGTVYRDFNANGTQQATETQGVSGISVTAYDCNGVKYGPVVTDQFGKYTFSNPAIKYPVRVEFSDPAGLDVGTVYGSGSKSSVQFVSQASCAVNLGIANPTLYCQDNPTIFIPCYTYGDPLNLNPSPPVAATALSGNTDALVSFPYDESNTAATGMTPIAEAQVMGTVWGLGYNRVTKDLFVSATLHRHAGLGPLGVGGIYVTHTSSASVTTQNFIDVSTIGIDVGGALVPVNGAGGRGLSADKTKPSNDAAVFSLIGKVGIGGLEVSEDGQSLWFVNLYDKKLYSIDISAYNTSGTKPTSANVKSYAIPDPACSGGSSRPWALHISSGKLYVGSVCDALTSKSKSDLRAYVYAFDISTSTFSQVFDFPLTYPKGYGISPLNSPGQAGADSTGWYPWTDSFDDLIIPTTTATYTSLVHPQPMLADIDIDVDGSMVLGFGDRTGMQGGFNNANTDPSDTKQYTVNPAAGDVLRAYYSNGSYILENDGKVGPYSGTGVGNKQGPGSGEFYDDNYTGGNRYVHTELALGGLALKSGSGHVVGATIDPVANIANSGGVKYWNNQTGVAEAADIVYTTGTDPGTFAKAAGLGEPDLNCDLLEVIEIGNRVWIDTNKDGVQDACEPPLAGVKVDLYKGTTKIASTTTNASGEYYFSTKANLTTGTWSGTGADTTLLPNTAYSVVFGNGQFANNELTVNGTDLKLTVANSTTTNANDQNDSDALVSTVAGITAPVISLTTGGTGYINHSFDAGFYPPLASLGDYTFIDANKDGIQDAGETPLANVKVTLYLNGVASATTVTSATGFYSFTGLTPGSSNSYVVGFTAPTGYTTTIPLSGTDKALDSDADPITGKTQSVTLAPDENNPTLDAGFYIPTAGLGDFVWLDTDKDGIQDAGEPGIQGVVVTLYTNGVASVTTVTDASGLYSFTGLTPGSSNSYVVGFTAPTGYTTTTPLSGTDKAKDSDADLITGKTASVTLAPGEFNPTLDAGYYPPVQPIVTAGLGDFVWLDTDKDGIQDAGEPGIQGVVVTLYTNGVASATTVTDASGLYSFTGLTPGSSNSYVVGFTAPTGYTTTTPLSGTDKAKDSDADLITGKTASVTLAPGELNPTLDAGYYLPTAGLGDFVWLDTDKDGIQDAGEPGIQGVVVTLYTNGVASATTVTNASGFYSFTGLTPGSSNSYVVGFTAPSGYTTTTPLSGTDKAKDSDADLITGKTASVTLAPGEFNPTLDAGYYPPVQPIVTAGLGDFVWLDTDKDGIQDAGEPGIQGVVVTLYTNGVASATTVTDASGLYSFTGLTPGSSNSYVVGFTAPTGYTTTTPLSGTDKAKDSDADLITGKTASVTLAPGEFNPTLDAGYYLPTASLGDFVWLDTDKDGIQDAGEPGIQGVVVTLYTNGVASATTVTNASGFYSFTGLTPGSSNSYVVGFTAPSGYTTTTPLSGTDKAKDSDADLITGKTASVTLAPGEFNPTLDAGYYPPVQPIVTAGLGDFVWLDTDKDGIQDAGEPGIQGVVVTLYTNGVVSATTVTDASGLYSFTGLTPGSSNSYVVGFTAPTGYTTTIPLSGTDKAKDSDADLITGKTASVTLAPGELNPTLDAGYYLPTAGLGDFVWLDTDKDGIQDAGEPGIQGVVVTLYTNGVASATTVTNASGFYSFTGLTPGSSNSYVVGFTAPSGYTTTTPLSGTDKAKDSDADLITGKTASVTLAPGEFNPTLDAGYYPPVQPIVTAGLGDFVWLDTDKDGIQDAGEPGIQGVVVTLYTNGVASATTVTDASGLYSFTGLTPGSSNSYVVGFTAPTGYTTTTPLSGTDKAKDSDADLITGKTASVTLAPGEFNPTLDAGYYAPSPVLSLEKFVDKSNAKVGDVLTYTIILTNTGTVSATNVVVQDSSTTGLSYIANSATAPTGTTFVSGAPVSTWSVASISAGQSLSLTFQATADSSGILYNRATIPGDTASVCTSIPFRVCAGSDYLFRLTAAPGRSSYKWFKDNVEITGQTTNTLDVTAPGTYSLGVDNVSGKCPDFSCCPFIVEEDSLPTFQAQAVPVTCLGNVAQANGKITLSGFKSGLTYQYSAGNSFNAGASLSGVKATIPANGVIVSNLANPAVTQAYTIRVYNSSGCYTDVTVLLIPTVCDCPASVCVPVVIRQTRGAPRIGIR